MHKRMPVLLDGWLPSREELPLAQAPAQVSGRMNIHARDVDQLVGWQISLLLPLFSRIPQKETTDCSNFHFCTLESAFWTKTLFNGQRRRTKRGRIAFPAMLIHGKHHLEFFVQAGTA